MSGHETLGRAGCDSKHQQRGQLASRARWVALSAVLKRLHPPRWLLQTKRGTLLHLLQSSSMRALRASGLASASPRMTQRPGETSTPCDALPRVAGHTIMYY